MVAPEVKDLDEARRALSRFGDFEAASIEPYPHGFSTQKFLVTAAGRRFILRRLNGALPFERLQFVAASQEHLWKSALAPRPVPTSDGPPACQQGTWWYLLSEFLPGVGGQAHVFSPALAAAMGSLLGCTHASYRSLAAAANGARYLQLDRRPAETLEQLAAWHARTTGDTACIRIIDDKLARLGAFKAALLDGVEGLPQQVIHGDFYVGNVVFTERGTIAGLIDFDQSCVFYRCYEVLRGIMTSLLHVPEPRRLECLQTFLGAYCRVVELSWQETASMLSLYYFVLLGSPFGLECSQRRERNYTNLREFARYRWELARWIGGRFAAVQEVISLAAPLGRRKA